MKILVLSRPDDVRGATLAGATGATPVDRPALQRALIAAAQDLVLIASELAAIAPAGADAIVIPEGADDADAGERSRGRGRRA